jgi:hypothetical protein
MSDVNLNPLGYLEFDPGLFEEKILKRKNEGYEKLLEMYKKIFSRINDEDTLKKIQNLDYSTEVKRIINFLELKNIVDKMLEILYILVDYYMILNNKLLV